ncbi:hypothetical protein SAICODRAFT_65383 [Saitoella complicata NRRL Y-17804]|nr:uncharacterized protein SAICODRAFT_65383 [Saitoella complicata NRRL Y-17804]ODQ53783.1 hypothetical protein SAICODRAFT_65383 [Saitoella complicata NRRL Y-17804]
MVARSTGEIRPPKLPPALETTSLLDGGAEEEDEVDQTGPDPEVSAVEERADEERLYGKEGWGREKDISAGTRLGAIFMLLFTPTLSFYFLASCTNYQCSLSAPIWDIFHSAHPMQTWLSWFPTPTWRASIGYALWVITQGILYVIVPGKIGYGQRTPAGYLLPYRVNGLNVYILTHVAFAVSVYYGIISAGIIAHHWQGLFVAANVYGYLLTIFAYVKARYWPSHPEDRKWSGSIWYDLMMGVEFNPRIGKLWDFKLFHNGRPGIIAWTLIDISFAGAQYEKLGYVTNSMWLVIFLHGLYVVDFFYNEDWYLRTIDIAHDHFGYYLAWGDTVWLPFMYTLQAQYLFYNPIDLEWYAAVAVFSLGVGGYWIFRTANHQKDLVRSTDGKCTIWGKPAQVIRTVYVTSDGAVHKSLLLVSGFWGWSHQFNYVGDLLLSFAMCAACGLHHLLPYFYIIYMFILLNHRIWRSEKRCRAKYGKYWEEYCERVPYKLIPGVY